MTDTSSSLAGPPSAATVLTRLAEAATTPLLPVGLPRPVPPAALRRRPARTDRAGPARDRRRRHDRDPPRRRLGRPRPRPVRPDRHRRRRRPPVARLLADPRPARRRPHLDHRQGRPRRQGQQPPGPPRPGRHAGAPRAGRRRLRPAARAAASSSSSPPVRRHPGDRDAAQPVPGDRLRRRPAARAARTSTSSWCTSPRASRDSIFLPTCASSTGPGDPARRPLRRRARRPRRRRPRRPGPGPGRAHHPRLRAGRAARRARPCTTTSAGWPC